MFGEHQYLITVCLCISAIVGVVFRFLRVRNTNASVIEIKRIEAERDLELERIKSQRELDSLVNSKFQGEQGLKKA